MTNCLSQTRHAARAFTLIEVTITLIIISLLSSLALVAARRAIKSARIAAETQTLVALKNGITNFKNEFGFLPPLIHDNNGAAYSDPADPTPPSSPDWPAAVPAGPVNGTPLQPIAVGSTPNGAAYLQGFTSAAGNTVIDSDYRFSNLSLSYFLMGLLDVPGTGGKPIDGADGPRLTAPTPDGKFTQKNKAYDAAFDATRQVKRIKRDGSSPYSITFNDRWDRPVRYYRWEPRPPKAGAAPGTPDSTARTLVPRAVGDPRTNPKIRGASYALVITGEDRLTDMRQPIEVGLTTDPNPAMSPTVNDDIVEVEE